jgi:hypothetical protein
MPLLQAQALQQLGAKAKFLALVALFNWQDLAKTLWA